MEHAIGGAMIEVERRRVMNTQRRCVEFAKAYFLSGAFSGAFSAALSDFLSNCFIPSIMDFCASGVDVAGGLSAPQPARTNGAIIAANIALN